MNLDSILDRLRRCELPMEAEVEYITALAKDIFIQEDNVLCLHSPITIVGDIHGQFYDLRELFSVGGTIPDVSYLFLGDFVDRGYFSVETFLLLITYKVKYPTRISLLRGNHESRQISQVYGYNDECLRKYGSNRVWRLCCDVFDCLPLCATVDSMFFCVHGGLSPSLKTIDDIRGSADGGGINRFSEVPHEGLLCDLMWSDPLEPSLNGAPSVQDKGFQASQRGAGFLFGADIVEDFLHRNDFGLIVRSHQLIMEGLRFHFNNQLLTLWSCPNYCYRAGNVAAILEIGDSGERNFKIFDAAPRGSRALPDKRCIPDYFL